MKLSPLFNERNSNANRDVKKPAPGRGAYGGCNKENQVRGDAHTKYSSPKITAMQHNEIIRLIGGATADMEIC
jgi:hypothetical protein